MKFKFYVWSERATRTTEWWMDIDDPPSGDRERENAFTCWHQSRPDYDFRRFYFEFVVKRLTGVNE